MTILPLRLNKNDQNPHKILKMTILPLPLPPFCFTCTHIPINTLENQDKISSSHSPPTPLTPLTPKPNPPPKQKQTPFVLLCPPLFFFGPPKILSLDIITNHHLLSSSTQPNPTIGFQECRYTYQHKKIHKTLVLFFH